MSKPSSKRPALSRPARRRGEAPVKHAATGEPLPCLPPREWFIARLRNTFVPQCREVGAHESAKAFELAIRFMLDEDRLEAHRAALLQ
jgi:hypothetical protein